MTYKVGTLYGRLNLEISELLPYQNPQEIEGGLRRTKEYFFLKRIMYESLQVSQLLKDMLIMKRSLG